MVLYVSQDKPLVLLMSCRTMPGNRSAETEQFQDYRRIGAHLIRYQDRLDGTRTFLLPTSVFLNNEGNQWTTREIYGAFQK